MTMRKLDVVRGDVYERLTIIQEVGSPDRYRRFEVRCECGTVKIVMFNSLRSGRTTSCGCLRNERVAEKNTIHNESKTVEYKAWWDMISRCTDTSHPLHHRYGGRGISVCHQWSVNFMHFLKDVGRRPADTDCIDRIDNDHGYCPGNVRWTTYTISGCNTSTSRWWVIHGIRYGSCEDAALNNHTTNYYIRKWCGLKINPVTNQPYLPLKGCYSELKYPS